MEKIIDIGVIIVDYRSDPLVEKVLTTLSQSNVKPSKVLIVENLPIASRASSPENLDVQYLRQEHNMGFGRAINIARKTLQSSYIFILNPDIELYPKTLSVLYQYMNNHPDIGLIVPKLLDSNKKLQYSARKFYDLQTVLFRRTHLGRLFPNHPVLKKHLMLDWDHNSIQEIDWALGACMLIRAEAVADEIFDPRFFLYFEDVDLCLRLKKNGWKVVYHPEAVAIHAHRQKSRKSFFSRENYEHFVSWIKFMLKYKSTNPSAE